MILLQTVMAIMLTSLHPKISQFSYLQFRNLDVASRKAWADDEAESSRSDSNLEDQNTNMGIEVSKPLRFLLQMG